MHTLQISLLVLLSICVANAEASTLKLEPCRKPGVELMLRCGDLLVPENPATANSRKHGRKIKLHVVESTR